MLSVELQFEWACPPGMRTECTTDCAPCTSCTYAYAPILPAQELSSVPEFDAHLSSLRSWDFITSMHMTLHDTVCTVAPLSQAATAVSDERGALLLRSKPGAPLQSGCLRVQVRGNKQKCGVHCCSRVCKGWVGRLRGTTLRAQSQPAGASTIWLCTITRKTHTHTCVGCCVGVCMYAYVCVSVMSCGLLCVCLGCRVGCRVGCTLLYATATATADPQWTTANRLGTPHICHCGEVFRVVCVCVGGVGEGGRV